MVDALDVSSSALDLAKQNTKQNKVDINFIEADIFEYKSDKKYDLIVSNPPYVRNLEKKKMLNNVLHFEPELALFVEDDDPLIFYRAILKFAHNNLIDKGKIYFEINEYLYNEMKALLISLGYINIGLRKDSFGKFRFVRAMKSTI
jgi:release factor glutamine methyltransferase